MDVETKMLAGEELAFIPDSENQAWFFAWPSFKIVVGYLGK